MITALNLLISPSPQISDEVSLLKYLDYDLHLEDLLKWTQMRESLHIHIPKSELPTDSLKFAEMWTKITVFVDSEQFVERCVSVLHQQNIEVEYHAEDTFVEVSEMTGEHSSYIDIYKKALDWICSFCGKRGELLLCLVCGDKLCRSKCAHEMPDRQAMKDGGPRIHGNGAKHVYLRHAGRCVFFDVYTARYFAYDTQKIAMFSHGYKDALGREVNIKDIEYDSLTKYRLNRPLLARLRDEYRSGKLRQSMMAEVERIGKQVVDHSI